MSRLALAGASPPAGPQACSPNADHDAAQPDNADTGGSTAEDERHEADNALWRALSIAPAEGYEIGELIRLTGMSRPTLYRRLREHTVEGRAVQVSRGRWRAQTTEGGSHE